MSNEDKTKDRRVIWFYGWTTKELVEMLTPTVAECHIHKGAVVQAAMAPKHYFSGSIYEIRKIRGHLLIENIGVEEITPNLWACNKDNWSKKHRPHIMMGKPTVLKMNVKGTVTGRMSCAKPNIKEIKRRP